MLMQQERDGARERATLFHIKKSLHMMLIVVCNYAGALQQDTYCDLVSFDSSGEASGKKSPGQIHVTCGDGEAPRITNKLRRIQLLASSRGCPMKYENKTITYLGTSFPCQARTHNV